MVPIADVLVELSLVVLASMVRVRPRLAGPRSLLGAVPPRCRGWRNPEGQVRTTSEAGAGAVSSDWSKFDGLRSNPTWNEWNHESFAC